MVRLAADARQAYFVVGLSVSDAVVVRGSPTGQLAVIVAVTFSDLKRRRIAAFAFETLIVTVREAPPAMPAN
jgi:hypothetical protein